MQRRTKAFGVLSAALGVAALFGGASSAHAQTDGDCSQNRGVIFVHGGAGSAGQFESQAMRFNTNGFDLGCIREVEYNSTIIQMIGPQVAMQIDAAVADLQADGAPDITLVGHSLGTAISQAYLASPARAANITRYVNVDGGLAANGLPVDTLAIFAGAAREARPMFPGAITVTLDNQEHVEAVTSQAAFVEMFRFITGSEPVMAGAIGTDPGPFAVSGRTAIFPQNEPIAANLNPTVLVFELDPATAARRRTMMGMFAMPVASLPVDADGFFPPAQLMPGVPIEFSLMRDGLRAHRFFKPSGFLRSDDLVRLLTGRGDGSGLEALTDRDPATVGMTIQRFREFRGDADMPPGPRVAMGTNDSLVVNTATQSIELIRPNTAPSGFVGSPVAQIIQDGGSNGLAGAPLSGAAPFITIQDVFIPSSPTFIPLSFTMISRGDPASEFSFRIPRIPSTSAAVSVLLDDFVQ